MFIFFLILALPALVDIFFWFICFKFKKDRHSYLVFNLILQIMIVWTFTLEYANNKQGAGWFTTGLLYSLFMLQIITSSSIISFFWIKDKIWRLIRLPFLIIGVFIFLTSYYTYNFYIIQILALAYFILSS